MANTEKKTAKKTSSKNPTTKKTTAKSTTKKTEVKKNTAVKASEKKVENTKTQKNETKKIETKKVKIEEPKVETSSSKSNTEVSSYSSTYENDLGSNRRSIFFLVGGFVIGIIFMAIVSPKRIAKLKNGEEIAASIDGYEITADSIYSDLKSLYGMYSLIDNIDRKILSNMYDEEEFMDRAKETADYYIEMYETYGYTEEAFLSENGFKDYDAFVEYLLLDEYRQEYYSSAVRDSVTDKEIEEYYNNDVFGEISTKYIAISSGDSESDIETINEIINELNNGSTYDDVVSKYSSEINSSDLGYQGFNSSVSSSYLDTLKDMDKDSYTKEYVETDFGYTIIFKGDQKDKPELDDVKEEIIDVISAQKSNEDGNLYFKTLIQMRKDAKLEIKDDEIKKSYETYLETYK